jgi:hypothetical protein
MPKFKVERFINAPRNAVWEKLADIGNIQIFHPLVEKSVLSGKISRGMGAERLCTFYNNKGYVREEVISWDEGKSMGIIIKKGSMPVNNAVILFELADAGAGTKIKINGEFKMRGGLLGAIVGAILIKPMFIKMMNGVLSGLDKHMETGKNIGNKGKIEDILTEGI